jgi:hypothetical protein
MLNDFLPAIVSVGILAGAFLFVWSSDVRRTRRFDVPEPLQPSVDIVIDTEGGEQLSMSPE